MLSTGKLLQGGLPRISVVRVIDCPNMTSAVAYGCKATNQNRFKMLIENESVELQ